MYSHHVASCPAPAPLPAPLPRPASHSQVHVVARQRSERQPARGSQQQQKETAARDSVHSLPVCSRGPGCWRRQAGEGPGIMGGWGARLADGRAPPGPGPATWLPLAGWVTGWLAGCCWLAAAAAAAAAVACCCLLAADCCRLPPAAGAGGVAGVHVHVHCLYSSSLNCQLDVFRHHHGGSDYDLVHALDRALGPPCAPI